MGQGKGGFMSGTGKRWGHEGGVRVGEGKGGVMSGTGKRWGHEWDREKVGS